MSKTRVPAAEGWFKFDPDIDFGTCMPADQQPKIPGSRRT